MIETVSTDWIMDLLGYIKCCLYQKYSLVYKWEKIKHMITEPVRYVIQYPSAKWYGTRPLPETASVRYCYGFHAMIYYSI